MPRIFQFYLTSRLALHVSFGVPLGILRYFPCYVFNRNYTVFMPSLPSFGSLTFSTSAGCSSLDMQLEQLGLTWPTAYNLMQLVLGFDTPVEQVKRAYEHGTAAVDNLHRQELARFRKFTSKRKLFFSSRVTMRPFKQTARSRHGSAVTYVRPDPHLLPKRRNNLQPASPADSLPST
jgi:hypothetical protein